MFVWRGKRENYLCSSDDLGSGEARLEFHCVFLWVSSVNVSRLLVGEGVVCPLRGECEGLAGLLVAISYVGRSSLIGVLAGVRTAVL